MGAFVLQIASSAALTSADSTCGGLAAKSQRSLEYRAYPLSMRQPISGTSMSIRKIDMNDAGIVRTHFQLASHSKCMKNMITSMAFVQEMAIMRARLASNRNVFAPELEISEERAAA